MGHECLQCVQLTLCMSTCNGVMILSILCHVYFLYFFICLFVSCSSSLTRTVIFAGSFLVCVCRMRYRTTTTMCRSIASSIASWYHRWYVRATRVHVCVSVSALAIPALKFEACSGRCVWGGGHTCRTVAQGET